MMSHTSTLTARGLSALLAVLDPDPDRAADRYETLRTRLKKFFAWQGVLTAEDCVDVTLDRVARRLSDGARIAASEPASYFHGVARNVLREHRAAQARETRHRAFSPRPVADGPGPSEDDAQPWRECLERCLEELPNQDRQLVLDYYREGGAAARIAHRRDMAARLGIGAAALRVRMHRLRTQIERDTRCRLHAPAAALTAAASTASASPGRTRRPR